MRIGNTATSKRRRGPRTHGTGAVRVLLCALPVASLVACATGPASRSDGAPANVADSCPGWSMSDYASARVVRRIRVHTDAKTGDSAMEETTLAPKSTPLLKTGTILTEYDFGAATKVQIVVGPPNLDIPLHPAPYRESFLMLRGSVRMKLGNGDERELLPGDMTVFEDTTASRGHGGRTGPCGYVALDIVP